MSPVEFIERAISHDSYDRGESDLSTTQILSPPQASYLRKVHGPGEGSIYKNFMSMIGTGIHKALEMAACGDEIAEHRFYHTWDIGVLNELDGSKNEGTTKWTLGGQMDWAFENLTVDFKVTTTASYEIKDGGIKEEHYYQQNINAWLANHDDLDLINGIWITKGAVLYWFRDWSYSLAKQGRHPEKPYMYHEFDILPADEIEQDIILPRMREHAQALAGNPRPCTADERWQKEDSWAVIKFGANRAYRTFPSEWKARACADKMKKPDDYMIEYRPGECVRCSEWCLGSVCPQYQEILSK